MALKTLAPKPFLVFPTGTDIYRWKIMDTRNGARPISRHKYLEFALLEAERLNKQVAERESKVICITQGQDCWQEGCSLGAGHLGWHNNPLPKPAEVVSIEKGQMSERQLSDSYVRGLIDGYNRGCDFGGKDDL